MTSSCFPALTACPACDEGRPTGQRLYRATSCEYVADVLTIDEDGDVTIRTVTDGDVVTFKRQDVQAWFVTDTRGPR